MYRAAESIKAELKKSKKLENGRGKENGKKGKYFRFLWLLFVRMLLQEKISEQIFFYPKTLPMKCCIKASFIYLMMGQ